MRDRFWGRVFLAAALFNFLFGGSIMLAPAWSYGRAYRPVRDDTGMALRFWRDFGFAVVLIGVGYAFVSRDVTRNRALVWLGVKLNYG